MEFIKKIILKNQQKNELKQWILANPKAEFSEVELAKHYIMNKF